MNDSLAVTNHSARWRRFLQPLLMIAAVLASISIVLASLNNRPFVDLTSASHATARDAEIELALAKLNSQLAESAQQAGLQTASRADNLTIARRASLALIGSGMSLEEVRAFEMIPVDDQLSLWTETLLSDKRWANYFAERFSRAYVGSNQGPFLLFRRGKLNEWLAEQFAEGKPYDAVVRSLIAAEGLWTDSPPVNFLTATMTPEMGPRVDTIQLAGRTSRVFLGQRIDCLQCHDDFLGQLNFVMQDDLRSGTQHDFHGLAAFFAGSTLAEPAFRGIKEDGEAYRYQFLGDSEETTVEPAVPFANELLPTEGKPRERLAKWITHPKNVAFARATVNRVWALLLSRPLVEPVDSIPMDDSAPAILNILAEEFVESNFNLKRLIRLILASDAFCRDSRAAFKITEQHEQLWAVFPITQLRPEQVSGNLIQATRLTVLNEGSSLISRLRAFGESRDFLKRFGDRGEDEFESDAVTIPQRLILMNGNIVAERTKVDLINNAGTRIATLVADDDEAVELVMLSTLNRRPTAAEASLFCEMLSGKSRNARSRVIGDIYWAIINSTEFSWNH